MNDASLNLVQRTQQPFYPNQLVNLIGRIHPPRRLNCEELMYEASKATSLADWGEAGDWIVPCLVCGVKNFLDPS